MPASVIDTGLFKDDIVPVEVEEVYVDGGKRKTRSYTVEVDEGPRRGTNVDALAKTSPPVGAIICA